MGALVALLPTLINFFGKFIPDPQMRAQMQLQLAQLAATKEGQELDAQLKQALAAAGIVQAEAQSSNWLTSSWRPLTMLTFVTLIVCRMFGWTSTHVTEQEYLQLWQLVELGLGGYVIGRSVEKVAPAVAGAFKGGSQ